MGSLTTGCTRKVLRLTEHCIVSMVQADRAPCHQLHALAQTTEGPTLFSYIDFLLMGYRNARVGERPTELVTGNWYSPI